MPFRITLTHTADSQLHELEFGEDGKDLAKLKKVRKCLGLLQTNPRHPSLETHEYVSMRGTKGERVWEAYVENRTPAAWRVFWHYGPDRNEITILAVTAHP
ncbi:MAG: hypothetical protein KIS66_14710 [Fimbriimonadaceae bacterium]|nr:hypothetical protein [Fimbriimonadaceae bacterium]